MYRYLIIQLIAAMAAAYLASRKGRNWPLWTIVSFLFPFALLVLMALGGLPVAGLSRRCARCGNVMGVDTPNCPACGNPMPIDLVQCKSCGRFVPLGTRCRECGGPLS